ncbi:MAG: hypothetical protein V8S87_05515 [Oscillospiraceae bacterium]
MLTEDAPVHAADGIGGAEENGDVADFSRGRSPPFDVTVVPAAIGEFILRATSSASRAVLSGLLSSSLSGSSQEA